MPAVWVVLRRPTTIDKLCCWFNVRAVFAVAVTSMNNPYPDGMKRRRRGLPANRELRDLAAGIHGEPKLLDLVHVTAVGAARQIITAGQIEKHKCSVFNRELVYTFVARPAYRFRTGAAKSDQINRFPFVFVISPEKLGRPYHIYPFDTGAGVAGLYGDSVDPFIPLEDYELDSDLVGYRRHIAWAFGSNVAYYDGNLKAGLQDTLKQWQSVGRGCLKIAGLAGTGSNQPDKRASAIEVAYSEHLRLKDHVRLVVMPQQLIEDNGSNATLIEELRINGIDNWELYDWRPNETPDFFADEITRIIRRYLEGAGQL